MCGALPRGSPCAAPPPPTATTHRSLMSEPTTTAGPGGRGPAPPLPDKPPSVAERTRLLRSSFRKEETEKPRMPPDNRSLGGGGAGVPPPLAEKPSLGSQGTVNNGGGAERSPSPASGAGSGGVPKANGQPSATTSTTTLSEKTVSYIQPPAAAPVDQNGKTPVGRTFHGLWEGG